MSQPANQQNRASQSNNREKISGRKEITGKYEGKPDAGSHPSNQVISLSQRLLIGRGRDGLIFRIGTANMHKTGPHGVRIGGGWGGWVLKVPRFHLSDLPQHYLKAVAQHISSSSALYYAKSSMVANFNFEADLQSNLWTFLCDTYLPNIGFPQPAYGPWSWQPDPQQCASKLHIFTQLNEDNVIRSIDALVDKELCHMMPEGVMDAFQALIHHFTETLLLNFCRDILHQLEYLETKGVVHGDFKLSNVLLFVFNDKHYVFVLADFWDAYTVDPLDGSVLETKTNEEMADDAKRLSLMAEPSSEFRRILRWKFTTEKFGTRLYKDPHILTTLRECSKSKKKFRNIKDFNAGAINLWSFGVVMGSLLASNRDSEKIKTVMKDEILFSGRNSTETRTLTEPEAVAACRKLYTNLLMPTFDRPSRSNKMQHPNRLIGNNKLVDSLKEVIMTQCMKCHDERGTTRSVIDALDLDSYLPKSKDRNIALDLHSCGRCTMCVWMSKIHREER